MINSKSESKRNGIENYGYWLTVGLSILVFGTSLVQAKIVAATNQSGEQNHERPVSKAQRHVIESDLRSKTGITSLIFDENGVLIYDRAERTNEASETMRRAITGAIEDPMNIFQILDYSGSKLVQFAETDSGTKDMSSKVTTYLVMMDFADFKESRVYSPKNVMDSFTVGLTLFHEIDHKVGYDPDNPLPESGVRPDKSAKGIPGVIQNTNKIRNELGLMLRESNRHRGRPYKGLVAAFRNTLEIRFLDNSGRTKSLRWKMEKN